MPTFETPEPITLTVDFAMSVAHIEIHASDRTDTVVTVGPTDDKRKHDVRAAEETRVVDNGGTVLVESTRMRTNPFSRNGSIQVRVELPTGSHVRATTAVGGFSCTGRLGECHVTTHHGDVSIAHADGPVVIQNESGECRVGEVAGPVRLTGVNGGMHVGRARGDVEARTANGAIRVAEVEQGSVTMTTAAGELEVGIRAGTAAWLDVRTVKGRLRNSLDAAASPEGAARTVELRARTYAGDIVIRRAG
jgi:DUF4097 and DUF4098 domain-containing protein YvlB